jgi:hypothetical protein
MQKKKTRGERRPTRVLDSSSPAAASRRPALKAAGLPHRLHGGACGLPHRLTRTASPFAAESPSAPTPPALEPPPTPRQAIPSVDAARCQTPFLAPKLLRRRLSDERGLTVTGVQLLVGEMARRRVRGSRSARWRGDDGPQRVREGDADAEAVPKPPASARAAADGRIKPARGGWMLR